MLASLLGTDVGQLLDVRNEITLKMVLQSMGSVPSDVLFLKQEHLRDIACGWMPTTFLDGGSGAVLGLNEGIVTSASLEVQLPGIELASNFGLDDREAWMTIQVQDVANYYIKITFHQPLQDRVLERTRKQVIILQDPLSNLTQVSGALVLVELEKSQMIHLWWMGVVVLAPFRENIRNKLIKTTRRFDSSQKWCFK